MFIAIIIVGAYARLANRLLKRYQDSSEARNAAVPMLIYQGAAPNHVVVGLSFAPIL